MKRPYLKEERTRVPAFPCAPFCHYLPLSSVGVILHGEKKYQAAEIAVLQNTCQETSVPLPKIVKSPGSFTRCPGPVDQCFLCRLASTLSSLDALKPPKAPKKPPRGEGGGSLKEGEAATAGGLEEEEEEEEKSFFQKYVSESPGPVSVALCWPPSVEHSAAVVPRGEVWY